MNLLFLYGPFPCPPQIRLEREEDTFTSLTAGVFVLWERQRVCTAGGSLEVLLSGVHSVEDVGRARQDRRHPVEREGPLSASFVYVETASCTVKETSPAVV